MTQHGSEAKRVLVTEARERVGGNVTTVRCAALCCAALRYGAVDPCSLLQWRPAAVRAVAASLQQLPRKLNFAR